MSQNVSQRLHDVLGHVIAATKPGERLPSEPELARKLGVSRATLREAMRTFETQGMLRRRQGSGTYVTHPNYVIESGLEILESIETLADRIGLPVEMSALKVENRKPSEDEAQALGATVQDEVVSIERLINAIEPHFIDGRPVAYLIDILPQGVFSPDDLGDGFKGSILDLLLERDDISLQASHTEINAVTAPPNVARALGIQRGDVVLHFRARLYTTAGNVVDYSQSYFLPGYFRFHVVRRVG